MPSNNLTCFGGAAARAYDQASTDSEMIPWKLSSAAPLNTKDGITHSSPRKTGINNVPQRITAMADETLLRAKISLPVDFRIDEVRENRWRPSDADAISRRPREFHR